MHGSTTWGSSAFARQRPLATACRLELVDRRGYGASPDVEHSDARVDAEDLLELLDRPAHLVGHSFGAVGVLLAAERNPSAVRSLTLVEPGAYRPVADDPVVGAALERNRAAPPLPDLDPAEYLRLATEPVGVPPSDPTPERLRAAATAMRERPCWDVDVPLAPIAAAAWPKLVLNGSWETAPPAYRDATAAPLLACGRALAARIGAEHRTVPGAAHEPHWEAAGEVNAALTLLWGRASELMP